MNLRIIFLLSCLLLSDLIQSTSASSTSSTTIAIRKNVFGHSKRRSSTTPLPAPLTKARGPVSNASKHALTTLRGGNTKADPVSDFLNAVDLFGTGVFAFSGAVTAGKKGMDLLGMLYISIISAIGGGTVRDIVLDSGTVFWFRQPIYFKICAVTTIMTFLLWPTLESRLGWKDSAVPICTADAFGLGAFAVIGTQKAVELGLDPIMWPVVGLITCTFGGITRDVMCLQNPRVMYPYRTLYATAPLLGSIAYTLLMQKSLVDVDTQVAATISFMVTFTTRVLSFNRSWRLPHWKNDKDLVWNEPIMNTLTYDESEDEGSAASLENTTPGMPPQKIQM
uniref:Glycine transporter domain-containing protein n=1 Tax=Ditylum brightwellii TaxID=49249 RepID=A0A7S4V2I1_9STRA|mmetsp:Transcript_821/g.1033  ORF Transcript_821/g.1033 Transcript_821/m.1033 type:complete len:337 (+) Transcript_821:358-1368(+)